jgi:hypothetical protein
MLLSELITKLSEAMSRAGNVVVEGVDYVEHTVEGEVHKVGVWAHGENAPASAMVQTGMVAADPAPVAEPEKP